MSRLVIKKLGLKWLLLLPSIGAWLAGCAVGPNYQRPAVDSPGVFRDDPAATNNSFADLEWWRVYQDEALQKLVREALTNNYDLRIAMTRVEQARALAMQARSQFVPSAGYSGVVGRGRNALFGSAFPNNGAVANSASTTLNAFWEVDLWGRVRRLNESARAQFLATEEARRGVRLSLLSEVATDYLRLLELDEELDIASHTTNSFGESLKIFTQRVEGAQRRNWRPRAPRRRWRTRPPPYRAFASRFRLPKINSAFCWDAIRGR